MAKSTGGTKRLSPEARKRLNVLTGKLQKTGIALANTGDATCENYTSVTCKKLKKKPEKPTKGATSGRPGKKGKRGKNPQE